MSDRGRPDRIWIRTAQSPTANLSPLKSTRYIGGNQGNLLYQFSVCRALAVDSAVTSTIGYSRLEAGAVEARAEWLNSECDHLVLPLSSSFRQQMQGTLTNWAELIERLTIPVTVVGVGAQLRLRDAERGEFRPSRVTGRRISDAQLAEHEAAVRRFVRAVLDRSESIGVRGEVTQRYLAHLGFPLDRIDVIGCPSMFMWGPDFRMSETSADQITPTSRISVSFDHRIGAAAAFLEQTAADYPRSTFYAQDALVAQLTIAGIETRPDWQGDPRFPVHRAHPLYLQHRLVYYPTAWAWIRHLGEVDFAVGPRIHGTIAAILAGTPAHLLVHDSRTLEISRYHELPRTRTRRLARLSSLDELVEGQDYARFNAVYPDRFAAFVDFLTRNRLPNAYTGHSDALAAFDAAVEPATRARGVTSNRPVRFAAEKLRYRVRRAILRVTRNRASS